MKNYNIFHLILILTLVTLKKKKNDHKKTHNSRDLLIINMINDVSHKVKSFN